MLGLLGVTLAFATSGVYAQTITIPATSNLIPEGVTLRGGEKFRLMFITKDTVKAETPPLNSSFIDVYNTYIQNKAGEGHLSIRPYKDGFRVIASTIFRDARPNTGMQSIERDTPAIYYLDAEGRGAKIADNYPDFYDGSWDTNSPDDVRNESGNQTGLPVLGSDDLVVWTGSQSDGTHASSSAFLRCCGATRAVATPFNRGAELFSMSRTESLTRGTLGQLDGHFYGISPVFVIESLAFIDNDIAGGRFTYNTGNPPAFIDLPEAGGGVNPLTYRLSQRLGTTATVDIALDSSNRFAPPSAEGLYTLNYSVTDSAEIPDSIFFNFFIRVNPELTLGSQTVPDLFYTVGKQPDSVNLPEAQGGTGDLSYGLFLTMQDGMTTMSQDNLLMGRTDGIFSTPSVEGVYEYRYTVTDSGSPPQTKTLAEFTITINPEPNFGAVTTISLGNFLTGMAINERFPKASGGTTPLTYTLVNVPDGLIFHYTNRTLTGIPERPGMYQMIYGVQDADISRDSILVSMRVIQNSRPTDILLTSTEIAENIPDGTAVGTLSAEDPNTEDFTTVFTYTLVSGDGSADNSAFTINGDRLTINESPDFEAKSGYNIRIQVSDGSLTYSKQFTISVANEGFDITGYTTPDTVAENTDYTSGAPSTNGDPPSPLGSLTWTLSGDDTDDFTIAEGTGVLTLAAKDFEAPTDDNTDNTYEVTVIATDGAGQTAMQEIDVTVTDDDGETAIFTISGYTTPATIEENNLYTSVAPSTTGEAPIGSLTWTLSGDDTDDFTIDGNTGVLTLAAKDFEAPTDSDTDNTYEVTVTATDGDGNEAMQNITVTVTNVDFDITGYTTPDTVAENTEYTSLTPSTSGDTPEGSLTWMVSNVDDFALFTIDENTGVLTLAAKDFEVPTDDNTDNTYEVTVIATDGAGQTAMQEIDVTVTDVREDADFRITGIANADIPENTGYRVEPAIAGDTPIGSLNWSLFTMARNDAGFFMIDSSTGVITINALNFEDPQDANRDNRYDLCVIAKDQDENSSRFTCFIVTVTDVPFTITGYTADDTVEENNDYTSVTPSTSGDTPEGSLTWTLSNVDDFALFTIDENTGVLTLTGKDFEVPTDDNTDNTYEVTVIATDGAGQTAMQEIDVTVTDDDGETAIFNITGYTTPDTIEENNLYTSAAPSTTGEAPIGSLTWTLSGNDTDDFTIDGNTGVLTLAAKDFEAPTDDNTDNTYEVTVTATDGDGNEAMQNITVTVTNVDFDITGYTTPDTVAENTEYTSLTPSTSGDPPSPLGSLTWTVSNVDDFALFTIDENTGVLTLTGKDFEVPTDDNTDNTYEVTVIATDGAGQTAMQEIDVTVTDDDGETAIFTISGYTPDNIIEENTDYTSGAPTTQGEDPIGSLTWTLSGDDTDDFTIDGNTGVLNFAAKDFEAPTDSDTGNIYEVTVTATDEDGNTATQDIIITVTNVPFTITGYTIPATVEENTDYTSGAPSTQGEDPVGSLTWTLSGDDTDDFTIDSGTGVLNFAEKDFEVPTDDNTDNTYEVTVTATDGAGQTATQNITVTVTDVIEMATFTISGYTADNMIEENTDYTSGDPSTQGEAPIGNLTWTLSGDDTDDFTIDGNTGVVNFAAKDFEVPTDSNTDNIYSVTVTATDEDDNEATQDITITVTDVPFTITGYTTPDAIEENNLYTSGTPDTTDTIDTVSWTLSGDDVALFSIVPTTGVLTLTGKDFENPTDNGNDNTYEVTVTATNGDAQTATQDISITVTDVRETTSLTITALADATIPENTEYTGTPNLGGSPIGTVSWTLSGDDTDDFTIDGNTGVVTLTARDYEAATDSNTDNIYSVTVTATDEDSNTATQDITVTVTDVPFTITGYTPTNPTVRENTDYTSPSPDTTDTIDTVSWTLSGGDDVALFSIVPTTGVLTLAARDFENPTDSDTDNDYEVTVTATNGDAQTATQDITITVTDVRETTSLTITALADATIPENTEYTGMPNLGGSPIGTVSWTLSGDDTDDFNIDGNTGVVTLTARDYEAATDSNTDNIYSVTVTATDEDSNTATQDITVTVTDVPFTITGYTPTNPTVRENTDYTSPSPDTTDTIDTVSWTLSGGDDVALFSIVPTTGVLTLAARDFENPTDSDTDNDYEVTVTATNGDAQTATQDITITVTDVRETTSLTITALADATIPENTEYTGMPNLGGSPIGTVSWTLSGDDTDDFTIDGNTGVVNFAAKDFEAPTDSEPDNIYSVTVTATDEDSNTATQDITVTVTDVPFTITGYITPDTVEENNLYTSPSPDTTDTIDTVSWTLSGGDDVALFSIIPTTGVLTLTARDFENPTDSDTDNIYEVTVTATNGDAQTATQDITVTVTDERETTTLTITALADATIPENTEYTGTPNLGGSPIGTVSWTLSGDDTDDFNIDGNTGVVTLTARDYEAATDSNTDNIYSVTVTATDEDSNTATQDITVTVTDVPFTITGYTPTNPTVRENTDYTSPSPDTTDTIDTVSWTLSGGDDVALFSIVPTTGVLTLAARDFENPTDSDTDNDYEVTVTATNGDAQTATQDITITVTDVRETTSLTITALADATIPENTEYTGMPNLGGSPIGTVSWTLSGDDTDDFNIDGNTGVVNFAAKDFEAPTDSEPDNIYSVTVTATDEDSNTATQDITVTVTDVDFDITGYTTPDTVEENNLYTSGTPDTTDTIDTVSWTLSGGDDVALFSIIPTTGVLTLTARDFENPTDSDTDNIYEVTVTATNGDAQTATQDITVTVTDERETTTLTITALADATIPENTEYTGTPNLGGSPIGTVSWTLSGDDTDDFNIDGNTGVVTLTARDYEAATDSNTDNIYSVTVTATDEDSNTATQDITVTVTDVPFTITGYTPTNPTVRENTDYTSPSPDTTDTIDTVSWTLSGGDDVALFSIVPTTGVLTLAARDFENPTDSDTDNDYEVTVTATNGDAQTATQDITITVTDVRETTSLTITALADATIPENTEYTGTPNLGGSPIGTISWTLSGDDTDDFNIDGNTGVVNFAAKDYEAPTDSEPDNIYSVTVTATDEDSNTATQDITVTVTDVPFTITGYTDATIEENNLYTSGTPDTTDTIVPVSWTLSGGDDVALFSIVPTTGVLTLTARDFENPTDSDTDNIYEVTVTATNGDAQTATQDITVTVTDERETTTLTITALADATIPENTEYTGTPNLGGSPIGTVSWTLSGDDTDDFTIDGNTGVVTLTARDYEAATDSNTDNIYSVTVTATDEDSNTATQDITVTVTDVPFTITGYTPTNPTVRENTDYTSPSPDTTDTIDTVSWTLSGGDDVALFSIVPTTGVLTLAARDFENPTDSDTDNDYEVTVTATNGDAQTATQDITITVTDVRETTSLTITALADATIPENTEYTGMPNLGGSPIGTVSWTLSGDDTDDFTIDGNTGVITLTARDYEAATDSNTDNIYSVTVTATDEDDNEATQDITITVTDVPFTIIGYTTPDTVEENNLYSSGTPDTTDTIDTIDTVSWTLNGGDDVALFSIVPTTGVLTLMEKDFENPIDDNTDNDYEVTVTATNGDGQTATQNITVTVTDVRETTSLTITALADATIPENTEYTGTPNLGGSPIGTISWTLSGDDTDDFNIDGNTGVVTLTARDYEAPTDSNTDNIYSVTVTATDEDDNEATQDITITVTDVPFTITGYTDATIEENNLYTSPSPDTTDTIVPVSWTLSGDDVALFSIVPTTGVLTLTGRDFENPTDSDTDNDYEVTVTATNGDAQTATQDITVTVTDDDTETAIFAVTAPADETIPENSTYTGTPGVTGAPSGSLSWTLGGDDAGDFNINADTGVVTLVEPDYENPTDNGNDNTYQFTLTATDADGNDRTSGVATITVIDVIEVVDFTVVALADADIPENTVYTSQPPTTPVGAIGTVTWSLGGDDEDDFTIAPATGVVSLSQRNFEAPTDTGTDNTYQFTLTATDADGNARTSTATTITITDVSDADEARLSALEIEPGNLAETFDRNFFDYTASVDNSVTSITVTATPVDTAATVAFSGVDGDGNRLTVTNNVVSNLIIGENIISVTVTARDMITVNTYTIAVTRVSGLTQDQRKQVHTRTTGILSHNMGSSILSMIGNRLVSKPSLKKSAIVAGRPVHRMNGDELRNFAAHKLVAGLESVEDGETFLDVDRVVERAMRNSAFVMPVGEHERELTIWGSVGEVSNRGDFDETSYGGDTISALIGLDGLVASDWRVGMALGYSTGEVDYETVMDASGEVEKNMISVHPYMSWHPLRGLLLWASGGVGFGEYEISEVITNNSGVTTADFSWEGVDAVDWMASAGVEQTLYLFGFDTYLRAKGLWNRVDIDETQSEDGGQILPELTSTNWRVRVESETGRLIMLGSSSIRPYGLLSGRWDNGDVFGDDELFIDAGGGIEIRAGAFFVDLSFYRQVNDADTEENSLLALGTMGFDNSRNGEGLTMSVSRKAGGSILSSWQSHVFEDVEENEMLSQNPAIETKMGYGWRVYPAFVNSALVKTYARSEFEDEGRNHSVGVDFETNSLSIGLESGFEELSEEMQALLRIRMNF